MTYTKTVQSIMKMVRMDNEVHDALAKEGHYGQSLSDIVASLLKEVHDLRKFKEEVEVGKKR